MTCISNLKQASLAFLVWVNDQERSHLPFRTPYWDGGTQVPSTLPPWPDAVAAPSWQGLQNQAWFQFAWISNELESPQILVCPADRLKKAAGDWSANSSIGFLNAKFQNQAVSYLLWLDADHLNGDAQTSILVSDRHLNQDHPAARCSLGFAPVREVLHDTTVTGWRSQPKFGHGPTGNIALLDGSVAAVTTLQVRELFRRGDDNGAVHYMNP